ncbi:MAG TPA: hypothetical protein VMR52_06205 [Dehalococcoidia bacterium]|nr:hypothetical protein [Dehalococcoidia bacterium]
MRYQVSKAEPLGWRPGLDGLRGVAVLAVMLFHFGTRPEPAD